MKKILFMMLACVSLKAALSPTFQSAAEVKAIFESEEFLTNFGTPDRIVSCEKTETGYVIKSDTHQQSIEIVYTPNELLGPASFELIFSDLETIQ
jgi:hypothetical protein